MPKRVVADDSVVMQIADLLKTQLQNYLPGKVTAFPNRAVKWTYISEETGPEFAPAIGIFATDDGYEEDYHTISGLNPNGTKAAGHKQLSFDINVQIWLKGPDRETLARTLEKWSEGVVAVIDERYDLGGHSVLAEAKRKRPQVQLGGDRKTGLYAVSEVNVSIMAWVQQGSTRLIS